MTEIIIALGIGVLGAWALFLTLMIASARRNSRADASEGAS